jgi:hypothetical protein
MKFFAYWMSRGVYFLAPVDAQEAIIRQWRTWSQAIEHHSTMTPLSQETPYETWCW